METLLQACCFETAVTCAEAEAQSPFIKRMTLHLGQYMAIYLAETIIGSPRFLGVFLLVVFFVCVCVLGLFCLAFGRHLAFCFSPVLLQLENS